jgi:ribokinase
VSPLSRFNVRTPSSDSFEVEVAIVNDIVVVGSLNVDITMRAPRFPKPGETLRASELLLGPGGKGLNQAIAAARLGARVQMVGCVGSDPLSEVVLSALTEAGVDTAFVDLAKDATTGTAAIVVDETSGENAIVVAGGANGLLSPEHIARAAGAFEGAKALLVQLEAPDDTVDAALELAGRHGLIRILDPAPFRLLPDALLRKVDILTPNQIEASQLVDFDVTDVPSAVQAGRSLLGRIGGDVVVTLGDAGCVWISDSGDQHVPASRVEPVDTTGAGDAFNGALAQGLANGDRMEGALLRAVAAGTASTLNHGAAPSMPTPAQLET